MSRAAVDQHKGTTLLDAKASISFTVNAGLRRTFTVYGENPSGLARKLQGRFRAFRMVIKPAGYAIWELIQRQLDERFKAAGVENVYMPMFIPESLLPLWFL